MAALEKELKALKKSFQEEEKQEKKRPKKRKKPPRGEPRSKKPKKREGTPFDKGGFREEEPNEMGAGWGSILKRAQHRERRSLKARTRLQVEVKAQV